MHLDLIVSDQPVCEISSYLAKNLNFQDEQEIWIYCGHSKVKIPIRINENDFVIKLNQRCCAELRIRPGKWQIRREVDGIRFGPIVGIVCTQSSKEFFEKYFTRYASFLRGGLCILLTPKGFNTSAKFVSGKIVSDEKQCIQGSFPWPDSLYICTDQNIKSFQKVLQKYFSHSHFNSYHLDNRWQLYNLLKLNPTIKPFLPETAIFNSMEQIHYFLSKYHEVLLKPSSGSNDDNILKIFRFKNSYVIRFREKFETKTLLVSPTESVRKVLFWKMKFKQYILQQGIKMTVISHNIREFITVVQKKENGEWGISAVIGREGEMDTVNNNINRDSKPIPFRKVLEDKLAFTKKNVHTIYELSLRIAQELDVTFYNIGEISLTYRIDEDNRLWLSEIDSHLNKEFLSKYVCLENNIFSRPIQYATYLAGFSEVINPLTESM